MNYFEQLNSINVNERVEQKNGLSYLSWAWAWAEVAKKFPDATYTIWKDELGRPYAYDEKTGYMVYTSVTIEGNTKEMWLPVMDGANKAMKHEPYTYLVKNQNFKYAKLADDGFYYDRYGNKQTEYIEKTVEAATMFDVNKAIMRCLTKNLAMFGLGLYIYAGEDLPEVEQTPVPKPTDPISDLYAGVIEKLIPETNTDVENLLKYFQVTEIRAMTMEQGLTAIKMLEAKKEKK